ncbi:MAG: hypothetical protein EOP10_14240 [Proteobacteria bacterium]|nr:MAG: hypothetical protein EOP10_14240 [Pseudomonadota bacterium]
MITLTQEPEIFVRQRRELGELFGFETRNKYEILNRNSQLIGYAAEQSKGIMGFIGRQFLGHWRPFEITLFSPSREPLYRANHPFRWIFKRMELIDHTGRMIGAVQQRFAFIYKRFDIQAADGRVLFTMSSAPWKLWTFPFQRDGREVGVLRKKWSGIFSEAFTDKDNFQVAFGDGSLSNDDRLLMLTSAIFVDLIYFEKKAE